MTLCFSEASVDDLLHQVFEALFNSEDHPVPTKGPNREARGVTLELTNPRARLAGARHEGAYSAASASFVGTLSAQTESSRSSFT